MKEKLIKSLEKIITDDKLIAAFKKIKREDFISRKLVKVAYDDVPLPLMKGQTISQPTTVMMMLQALELKKGDKVLEIGTGSGYNAALIAEMVKPAMVYTTEVVGELVEFAKKNLRKSGVKNVRIFRVDGSKGLWEYSPFDKIIVTAGAPETPKQLLEQVKDNGILVAPVGPLYEQEMLRIKKRGKKLEIKNLGSFVFVPLRGKYGWKD